MLKNGIFCEMVILVVFKGFLLVKNLEILIQIVLERSIYYYSQALKCPGIWSRKVLEALYLTDSFSLHFLKYLEI